jgi:hypothetical protein
MSDIIRSATYYFWDTSETKWIRYYFTTSAALVGELVKSDYILEEDSRQFVRTRQKQMLELGAENYNINRPGGFANLNANSKIDFYKLELELIDTNEDNALETFRIGNNKNNTGDTDIKSYIQFNSGGTIHLHAFHPNNSAITFNLGASEDGVHTTKQVYMHRNGIDNAVYFEGFTTGSAQDSLATKGYVDNVAQGLDVKPSVIVLAASNISLYGQQEIDGVNLVEGNRVLVNGQNTQTENGIWIVKASASWVRAADCAVGIDYRGNFVFVEKGTNYADTGWVASGSTGTTTYGNGDPFFIQFSHAGVLQADNITIQNDGQVLKLKAGSVSAGIELYHLKHVNAEGILSSASLVGGVGAISLETFHNTRKKLQASKMFIGDSSAKDTLATTHVTNLSHGDVFLQTV